MEIGGGGHGLDLAIGSEEFSGGEAEDLFEEAIGFGFMVVVGLMDVEQLSTCGRDR